MKLAIHTLADGEFATLLNRTHDSFEKAGVPYMFVGGVATQAHTANYLCRQGRTMIDLIESPDFRIQDYFRATDDVDITLDGVSMTVDQEDKEKRHIYIAKKLLGVLDDIEGKGGEPHGLYESPTGEIVSIKLDRRGVSRPIFNLGVNDEPTSEKAASFNLYKGPEDTNERWAKEIRDFENRYYGEFIGRRQSIEIQYTPSKKLHFMVKTPEDLIATKIVRARPKDLSDVLNLSRVAESADEPIDYDRVRNILCSVDPSLGTPNLALVEKWEKFDKFRDSWKGPENSVD